MSKVLPVFLALLLLPAGCSSETSTPEDEVRAAITKTEALTRGFVYEDKDLERATVIRGLVDDDYRYKAQMSIDGAVARDEVVIDDALAVALLDAQFLDLFLEEGSELGAASRSSIEALRSQRFVVDPIGAPDLTSPKMRALVTGSDAILDAVTVFRHVERSIREALTVVRFNPEALDYVEREDPFPKPAARSDVVRYDLRAPLIVPFIGAAGGQLPDTRHFRKMAIYVKDGLVAQVLEEIDVTNRFERLVEALDLKVPANLQGADAVLFAIDAVNRLRTTRRSEPIRIRKMSLELLNIGEPVEIKLPEVAGIGSLSVLRNRGR